MDIDLTHALKEWAVAVEALEQAKTIMLLRKGGIREEGGRFKVAHQQVLLYPTYEHQQPDLLKAEYAQQVTPVTSGWHASTVRISSWAEITDILPVSDAHIVQALLPFHIWNEKLERDCASPTLRDRFQWKPRQPLYVLLLRTYKLAHPEVIPYCTEYGGCKSWIDLASPISIEHSTPVLADARYAQMVTEIRGIVGNVLEGVRD